MEKVKEYKGLIIIVLVLIIGSFYWTQVRPVQIKKDCSSFTETIPADVGVTKEQADLMNKNGLEKCNELNELGTGIPCLLDDNKERLPQPVKQVVREATKSEYALCLRRNGL